MIIDKTYFTGELSIPNVSVADSGIADRVDSLIEKYEPEFLLKVLGYPTRKAFIEGLGAEPIEQRWKDLRDGAEYTSVCGELTEWKGLVVAGEDGKQSLIANYVYFHYMRNNETQSTSGGEKVSKTENATQASAAAKMVWAWNEMCQWLDELYFFLNAKASDYPEWKYPLTARQLRCRINILNI